MTGTTEILGQAQAWRREGRPVALATVASTWGSAPRPPGSHMAICGTGAFVGSVSGGCVEGAVVEEAAGVVESGAHRVLEYGVSDDDAWAVGLACGGRVRIAVVNVGPGGLDDGLLDQLLELRASGGSAVLATWLDSGTHALLRPVDAGAEPEVDASLREAAREALLADRASVHQGADGEVLLRPHNRPVRVVIVGAVHIAQALAPLVRATGFDPVVVDPRAAFATQERFPGVRVVRSWPAEALDGLGVDHRTAVVTVTHDPKVDDPALVTALAGKAFYVGALGSRRTHAKRRDRLLEQGVELDNLERIHAPIGLDIGARTPEEIGVAIVAEIVRTLRGAERR